MGRGLPNPPPLKADLGGRHPWMQTPQADPSPNRSLLDADIPWEDTPSQVDPPRQTPFRMQTLPLGRPSPPDAEPPGIRQQAGCTHPTGMHTCITYFVNFKQVLMSILFQKDVTVNNPFFL